MKGKKSNLLNSPQENKLHRLLNSPQENKLHRLLERIRDLGAINLKIEYKALKAENRALKTEKIKIKLVGKIRNLEAAKFGLIDEIRELSLLK